MSSDSASVSGELGVIFDVVRLVTLTLAVSQPRCSYNTAIVIIVDSTKCDR